MISLYVFIISLPSRHTPRVYVVLSGDPAYGVPWAGGKDEVEIPPGDPCGEEPPPKRKTPKRQSAAEVAADSALVAASYEASVTLCPTSHSIRRPTCHAHDNVLDKRHQESLKRVRMCASPSAQAKKKHKAGLLVKALCTTIVSSVTPSTRSPADEPQWGEPEGSAEALVKELERLVSMSPVPGMTEAALDVLAWREAQSRSQRQRGLDEDEDSDDEDNDEQPSALSYSGVPCQHLAMRYRVPGVDSPTAVQITRTKPRLAQFTSKTFKYDDVRGKLKRTSTTSTEGAPVTADETCTGIWVLRKGTTITVFPWLALYCLARATIAGFLPLEVRVQQ